MHDHQANGAAEVTSPGAETEGWTPCSTNRGQSCSWPCDLWLQSPFVFAGP